MNAALPADSRVLITGGAGFIGSHVADAALAAGAKVAVVDNLATGNRANIPEEAIFYEIDICDRDAVNAAFAEFAPTHVSHHAAQASVKVSVENPVLDAQVNIMGGINVLDASRAAGVQGFVFSSTGGAIYGEVPEGDAANESWQGRPKSPYAVSKLAFEYYLDSYAQNFGFESTVLRYANVYGPRQDPHGEAGVVAIFGERVLAGLDAAVFARSEEGDPGCVRDYVFVGDVVRANLLALTGQLPERIYNVGTGSATTTLGLYQAIAAAAGSDKPPRFGPIRAGDLEVSVLDASRLRDAGWGAVTTIADGLAETMNWFRDRG